MTQKLGVTAFILDMMAMFERSVFRRDPATVIVKEHIDEETDDLDDDGIPDIFDDDEVTVAAGGTVNLEVSQASDSDKWRTMDDHGRALSK